ncbi:hypothetical protein N7456_009439 [Penicillium angulare]|uniref:BTB domain-containing protein n=1 Tax=Penicillium angulare TaxID=116970 RepID=A0A9W9F4M6_9EURO|nr:hypothetical protein N7456_009439 [Penicillium angulare]
MASEYEPSPVERPGKVDYEQPYSSPYEGPMTTIQIGNREYGLPDRLLRQIPRFRKGIFGFGPTVLSEIQEDVAHTFVHFLYTGSYQTILENPFNEDLVSIAEEYRKAVSVYQAARVYELPDLESLAKHYIELFDEDIPIYEMLRLTRDVFSALPENENWLLGYIERSLQRQLKIDGSDSNLGEVYQVLGLNHEFDIAVMKMVVESFSACLRGINNELVGADELIQKAKENMAACTADAAPEESIEEFGEKPVEEPIAEFDEEPLEEPIEEFGEEPAECPVESPEPAAATDEPPVEEAVEEPHEFPTTEPAEGWSFLQKVPSVAEYWAPDPHASRDAPAAQDVSIPESFSFQSIPKPGPALVNLSTVLEADLALYENWGNFTKKMKHKRRNKMRARGLPTPDGDGAIKFCVG